MIMLPKGDGSNSAEAVERALGLVLAAFDAGWVTIDWADDLLAQVHDGLEEVVIEPHFVGQQVEDTGLFNRIEAIIAQVSAHQG
jgi:hypothetical protein